ncbi:hypothetical protein L228DRAFT_246431 [Xylona heveae TC161]|uniref:Methyltransferase domain-containing protein n=1 Tax=Xylona heveae (strain CBS 132557 / TC161) TaxID=1328760 RepID=A0A165HJQ7_XYLHT|nr:hypothetical protein L228DRAFT_246431 [Xylona heveae TC161]KZF23618.1 hypothetical protein L228DRAFT_246431 [Xylona heveae TC161]
MTRSADDNMQPSQLDQQLHQQPQQRPGQQMEFLHLSAQEAYDQWAPTYDTMPNILVRTDNLAMISLREQFTSLLLSSLPSPSPSLSSSPSSACSTSSSPPTAHNATQIPGPTVIDLGCGTGRCTLPLLRIPNARIMGLDISPGMLAIAESRCTAALRELQLHSHCGSDDDIRSTTRRITNDTIGKSDGVGASQTSMDASSPTRFNHLDAGKAAYAKDVEFRLWDGTTTSTSTSGTKTPVSTFTEPNLQQEAEYSPTADGIISALVLEHFPLHDFFAAAYDMLGGAKRDGTRSSSNNTVTFTPIPAPSRNNASQHSRGYRYRYRYLLISNMHHEMGARTGAGFIDPVTGKRVRTVTFVHTVDSVLAEAAKWGFELVGDVHEKKVDADWLDAVSSSSIAYRKRNNIGSNENRRERAERKTRCASPKGEEKDDDEGEQDDDEKKAEAERKWRVTAQKWIGVNVWFGMLFRLSV